MKNNSKVDVCIVGSGVGGGVMAAELSAAGMSVVVLERGDEKSAADFMAQDELTNIVRQDFFAADYQESQRSHSGERAQPGKYSLLAQTLGGSTVHWGAWSWRYRPDEMQQLSREGPIEGAHVADWPISYAELEPYYSRAEKVLGVSGLAGSNPFEARRSGQYPNPPHVYRPASRLIESGANALGLTPFPSPLAINSRSFGGRAKCLNGGQCSGFGCPVHAKASSLAIQLPAALATGNCQILTGARALEITLDEKGRASGVLYRSRGGSEHLVRARQVIVACSSIASAQLLLLSRSSRFPNGLANSNDQVGRNLMCHVFSMVNFEMESESNHVIGPPGNVAIDDYHASNPERGFSRGAVICEAIDPLPIGMALKAKNYLKGRRAWGQPLSDYLESYPKFGGMIAIGEDLPVNSNRVDLDPEHTDADGIPLSRITHTRHDNDFKLAKYIEQRMVDIAEHGGALKTWATDYTQYKTASGHIMGTCRMGDDPETSVLNRWCQTHEVDNLWVVDGSFFPTSGGYNPTLTIFANAYRVAEHFIRQAKRLDLK